MADTKGEMSEVLEILGNPPAELVKEWQSGKAFLSGKLMLLQKAVQLLHHVSTHLDACVPLLRILVGRA